jgi:hypothetical protein
MIYGNALTQTLHACRQRIVFAMFCNRTDNAIKIAEGVAQ